MIRRTLLRVAFASGGLLMGIVGCHSDARGQTSDSQADPVAEELFRKGRDLVGEGNWTEGCALFATSYARAPTASTLMNLALCREHEGKVASAWAMYRRALVLARETPGDQRRRALEEVGRSAIEKLKPRLPRLLVRVQSPPKGTWAREGDQPVPLDDPVPLDPGQVEVSLGAPGHKNVSKTLVLVEGRTTTFSVTLEKESSKDVAPSSSASASALPAMPPGRQPPEQERPTWPWFVGGVGLVALGTATGFAFDAWSQASDLEQKCGKDLVCDEAPGFDPTPTNDRKNRDIMISAVTGAAGLGLVGVAVYGALAQPERKSERSGSVIVPWVAPGSAGVGARVAF